MTAASSLPTVTLHGGPSTPATLLGQAPARIPTAGKIRAGIKVLTKRAAGEPRACEIYERGLRDGHSFDRIEQALAEALPQLKNPLVPRNVPWFTVRAQDFGNPALACEPDRRLRRGSWRGAASVPLPGGVPVGPLADGDAT